MNVYYLSLKKDIPCCDFWDYGIIKDLFSGGIWDIGIDFKAHEVSTLTKKTKAIVVIPARHHADMVDKINTEINKIDKVVLFLMGDEEADFPVEKIEHDNIDIWVQNPHPGRHDKYNKIGTGYPPQSQEILPKQSNTKELNVFFSGQITHGRRIKMIESLREYELSDNNTDINRTKGFTQGLSHDEYYRRMAHARISPCPSGAIIPDSFRVFEALESMSIPLAEEVNPTGTITEYWNWLFGEETPFPKVVAFDEWAGLIHTTLDDYPRNVHQQTAWWINWKRNFAYKIKEQLQ